MNSPFRCTVRLTNSYNPPSHWGEDYVPEDKKTESNWVLYAPYNGTVIVSKKQSGDYRGGYGAFGNYLVIKCDNDIWVLMAHLKYLPSVKVGERVTIGQKVGIAGNTGNSTGRHLHIEVADHPIASSNWWTSFRDASDKPSDYIPFGEREVFHVVEWVNGKTREDVFCTVEDCHLRENKIGSLDPYETADCYGIVDGCYLVVYRKGALNYKTGFVRYSGGVKL